jgi:hypothetical protein
MSCLLSSMISYGEVAWINTLTKLKSTQLLLPFVTNGLLDGTGKLKGKFNLPLMLSFSISTPFFQKRPFSTTQRDAAR